MALFHTFLFQLFSFQDNKITQTIKRPRTNSYLYLQQMTSICLEMFCVPNKCKLRFLFASFHSLTKQLNKRQDVLITSHNNIAK